MLQDIRDERDKDKDYVKNLKFSIVKYGNMQSSLGFTAKDMIGNKFVKEESSETTLRRPPNFNMTKSVDMSGGHNTIYDDTGRHTKKRIENHILLEKAKRMIAKNNKL